MKFLNCLCAAAIALMPATAAADELLPAMTAMTDGVCAVNSAKAPGYAERGRLMIADGNYRGAADQLRRALKLNPQPDNQREAAEYYLCVAAAHIPGEDAAGLFSAFLNKYPGSPYRTRAMLGLAGAVFDSGDYAGALTLYRSINPKALSEAQANLQAYNEGYCELKLARYDRAEALFTPLLSTERANGARFYLAYIKYVQGDYKAALDGFSKVVPGDSYPERMAPYYLAQLYYRNGDYNRALTQARKLLGGDCPEEYLPEMQRVAGESCYELGDRKAAIPLLKKYVAAVESPQPSALYILGLDAYDSADYPRAIKLLQPVTQLDNAMGQAAYLVLGQAYMQQGKYDSAMLALDQAVRRAYDSKVTELAAYNYAVSSSQGGVVPFGSSVTQFENFLRDYPDSEMAPAVADYIINGYILDNNYAAALRAIENIKRPTDRILAAKQQVLYMYGARQLQAGRNDDAVKYLTEARSLGRFSAETASESCLWLGEALYRKGDYKRAVENYERFLRETPADNANHALALYDMAYARFALKEFPSAATYFDRFLSDRGSRGGALAALRADALNRRGDCSYYAKDFQKADADYARAITAAPEAADYPMFQQAVMKGLMRDHKAKIAALAAMMERFPSSALIPSALLETGESYSESGDNASAIATYTSLAERFPSTPQGRQGALLLAIAQLNSGSRDEAIASYKRVITDYPTSEEAQAAAEDLKHIYADMGDIPAYTRFLASVPDAPKLKHGEMVALLLEGVEKAAEAGRYNDALRQGEELVEAYPDAPQAVEALAIIAPVYEKQGKPTQALEAYTQLAAKASGELTVNKARMGIVRINRDLGNDAGVIEAANRLLASSSLGIDDRNEVMLARALALRNQGDADAARDIFESLAANPATVTGAKASYYLAQQLFDEDKTDRALTAVNALIDSNTPQEYWLARGFILLSDINRRKGQTFEADEYLRSLRENYPGDEADIFQMIDSRLAESKKH